MRPELGSSQPLDAPLDARGVAASNLPSAKRREAAWTAWTARTARTRQTWWTQRTRPRVIFKFQRVISRIK